jgi:hypothetical protein
MRKSPELLMTRTGGGGTSDSGHGTKASAKSRAVAAEIKMSFGMQFWLFSIRHVEVKRFQASPLLGG